MPGGGIADSSCVNTTCKESEMPLRSNPRKVCYFERRKMVEGLEPTSIKESFAGR